MNFYRLLYKCEYDEFFLSSVLALSEWNSLKCASINTGNCEDSFMLINNENDWTIICTSLSNAQTERKDLDKEQSFDIK